ncbi:sulfatase-like hydrolase/transferase [Kutzneria buriramensis]|uniref:Phosphoglycerol transferase MdoB-like AlkP superfamily enzyme n=1 Tax=Kutzneria buriramensis TaxID=1045776 RepID=A0A3E0GZ96_9PSEU|nr:sulfatase-like hydrolase/transferase [Kutzneria buriramensis]REH32628.1 phosphoglycerol transferase MdoB-like AlkP superfamily enzyme [Kutzneria buriramensis]
MSILTRLRRTPEPDTETRTAPSGTRRVLAVVASLLAFLLVLFALVAPDDLTQLTPLAFVRIPVEGLVGVLVVLLLPNGWRKPVALIGGGALGVLTILKLANMGFYASLNRPFDPINDWSFLSPGLEFLQGEVGDFLGWVAVGVAIVVATALIVLMALAAARLSGLAARHRTGAFRGVALLAVIWMVLAPTGAQLAAGQPLAASNAAALAASDVRQVSADLKDRQEFAHEIDTDAYVDTAHDKLLSGLRGKNVLLVFVESYGRSAVMNSSFSPAVDGVLDDGTQKLNQAGFAAKSGFLTSPTFGGGSWLAHSTLESGVDVNSQFRYTNLVNGNRFTLARAFKDAGWRTFADDPANTRDWVPETQFYGYNSVYDSRNVGYKGPNFSYAPVPDQYTMNFIRQHELSRPGPAFGEIDLVSSHVPWAPWPQVVDWNTIGDGTVFAPQAANGTQVKDVWPDPAKVQHAYSESIQYSLSTLISYLQNYGDDNTVMVFLGDHQAQTVASGVDADHDVPITIVAKDKSVLDRVAGWGWTDGLRPSPHAPVWPMSSFRDKFLAAFGDQVTK